MMGIRLRCSYLLLRGVNDRVPTRVRDLPADVVIEIHAGDSAVAAGVFVAEGLSVTKLPAVVARRRVAPAESIASIPMSGGNE